MVEHVLAAGENQAINQAQLKGSYDYIVVGSGASGSIVAGELSKTGADVLIVESGGADTGPEISNPSIWFYNVGGPLDWKLPIAPVPQLNNRKFNMALGHVLGGGSSINAMVWSRGMENDYDTWERNGATGWAFKDVRPMFKAQEDWEGGASHWRGVGGAVHIRKPGDPHPIAPAFLEAARQMGFPIIDDVNGPMRPGPATSKHEHCRRRVAGQFCACFPTAELGPLQPDSPVERQYHESPIRWRPSQWDRDRQRRDRRGQFRASREVIRQPAPSIAPSC